DASTCTGSAPASTQRRTVSSLTPSSRAASAILNCGTNPTIGPRMRLQPGRVVCGWVLVVDFEPSTVAADYTRRMREFLDERIIPAEAEYEAFRAERRGTPQEWDLPPVVEELKKEARARGLWNLFLPSVSGLSNVEYAPIAEVSGWSPTIAPEAINCRASDTGNLETLHLFGTPEQKQRWLEPLLEGEIRSAFAMTEPDVASSDATNIQTRIRRKGDEYDITGRKWWI